MAKEDPEYIEDLSRPISVGKRNLQEVQKILVHTDTIDMGAFRPVVYAAHTTVPDTQQLHKFMCGLYRDYFIDVLGGDINTFQKKQTWSIVFGLLNPKGNSVVKYTGAFNIKSFPDGTMRNIKVGFCISFDTQVYGSIILIPMHPWFNI